MGRIFLGNAMEFWWNPIILLTGGVSLRHVSGFEMVSVDVREVIVAGWWRGWELCSELGSFGSTDVMVDPQVLMRSAKHANTGCAMAASPHACALAQICGYPNKYK